MAGAPRSSVPLLIRSAIVWLVMVVVLVVVPDFLEQWIPLDLARITGWVLASGIWVIALDRAWQAHFRPLVRFPLQITAWLAAALAAVWISDQFRVKW